MVKNLKICLNLNESFIIIKTSMINGLNILIADDAVSTIEILQFLLEQEGAVVSVAENGQIAVEFAKAKHFDIVLMDIQMPVCDGIQATKLIREFDRETPIIAVTAASESEARDFEKYGFDDFFQKPVDFMLLQKKIEQYA